MTDRVQTLFVVLDKEYRTDDVETIVNAIQMVKGVSEVQQGEPLTADDYIARQTVRHEILMSVFRFVDLATKGGDDWREVKSILERQQR